VADCGRLWDGSPAAAVVGRASVLLLVVRPVAAELGHLAGLVSTLQADAARLGVVLVGAGPYKPEEITATFGVPVLGALPADRRAAAVLSGGAGGWKVLRRTPLLRAARGLAGALERLRAPDAAATLDRAVGRPAMGGVSGDEVGGRR